MDGVHRNICRLVALEQEFFLADAHLGDAIDHGPVLAATVMQLQREDVAGFDDEPLDLAVCRVLENRVAAPRPMHGPVERSRIMVCRTQALDDQLDLLRALAMRYQHRITSVDDDQILDPNHRDHARVGLDIAVLALDQNRLTAHAIA